MASSSASDTKNEFSVPFSATCSPANGEKAALLNLNNESPTKIQINGTSRVYEHHNFLLLGRQASTCDIRITHKSLSRQHAVLYYHSEKLWVLDLATKTGTFINETPLAAKVPMSLKNGDVLQFGKAQPTFTIKWERTKAGGTDNVEKKDEMKEEQVEADVSTNIKRVDDNMLDQRDPQPEVSLTGRAKRQAEIAAMMASLEETPAYSKYVAPEPSVVEKVKTQQEQQQQSSATSPVLEKYRLPLQDSTTLSETLSKSNICHISMDPSGTRFVIANMDSSLQLYDFAGLSPDKQANPFANFTVADHHPISGISYSSTGGRFLVATHSLQPKVFDREGNELLEFTRGDVYVRDPCKTIGHTGAVTSVGWHALEKSIVFSTSRDGSLKVWNVDDGKLAFGMLKCSDVVLIKNPKSGKKTIPSCMVVTPASIWMGTECGSLQMYKHPFVSKLRPQQFTIVRNGEEPIRCIAVSVDGTKIAASTKSGVVVYNTQQKLSTSSTPLATIEYPPNVYDRSKDSTPTIAFSPNGRTLCVGMSIRNQDNKQLESFLVIYPIPKVAKSSPRKPVYSCPLTDCQYPLVGLLWHSKLNQILVATTREFQVYFSPEHSSKGAVLNLSRMRKKKKKRDGEDELQQLYQSRGPAPGTAIRDDQIQNPNALPMFGGNKRRKKLRDIEDEQRAQDLAAHKPEPPSKGVYSTNVNLFTRMVMDNTPASKKMIADKDPREALFEYTEGKSYISAAYEGNKERVLAERTVEEDEDEMDKNRLL
jgi:pSer/pThr/pTyr-binding forkhead associated (FHA) protein